MAIQPDLPPLPAAERRFFFREVIGITQAVASVLVFLALLSLPSGRNWIGSAGAWVAGLLTIVLGSYVSFVIPFLFSIGAWNTVFTAGGPPARWRTIFRVFGGAVILSAACGLLALHAEGSDRSAEARFAAGGLIGSFLIQGQGMDLTRFLGRVGSFVALYGLTIIGVVLFTQTLVRDLGGSAWRLMVRVFPKNLRETLHEWGEPFAEYGARLFEALKFRGLREYLGSIDFDRALPSRVISPSRVIDFRPRGGAARSSSVLGRAAAPGNGARPALHGVPPPPPAPAPPQDPRSARGRNGSRKRPSLPGGGRFGRGAELPPASSSARPEPHKTAQPELALFPRLFELPALDLLAEPPTNVYRMSEREAARVSRKIEETLEQFKIAVEVAEVVQGPVVTRFALKIVGRGVRVSKIQGLEDDLALALEAQSVRVLTPIPGQAAVGIEVPNKRRNPVMIRELLESEAFAKSKSPLSFVLGKNIAGEPVVADLAQMPHVLIAGATGAGKSVCLNSLIASILFRNPPDRVKMMMIDPKRVELSIYQAIPHLLSPVVSEPKQAAAALAWLVDQMEKRYQLLADVTERNIDGYNAIISNPNHPKAVGRNLKFMPQIVVIIDELADLMMTSKNEVEEYIIRLAQMARAVGIHLVVATQRPSVNVITGLIKANFPTRIAFRVSSKVDSRTILDFNGAEALLGKGDMLYSPVSVKPFRLQGAFVSDSEIERLADYIRTQERARYEKEKFEPLPSPSQRAKEQLQEYVRGSTISEDLMATAAGPGDIMADPDDPGALPLDTAAMISDEELATLSDDSDREESYGSEFKPSEREPAPSPVPAPAPPARLVIPTRGRVTETPLRPAEMDKISDEDLYDIALRLVLESRKASVSYIQRRLKIGYSRAGRVMDMLELNGIVGPFEGSKPRRIIVDAAKYLYALDD